VEMVEFRQVLWLVMHESAKDRVLGVDNPGQTGAVMCPIWNDLLIN
jgi:hypothetical protein